MTPLRRETPAARKASALVARGVDSELGRVLKQQAMANDLDHRLRAPGDPCGAASTGPLRGDGACFVRGQTVTQQAACGPRWDSASSARDTGAKEVKCISNARWSGTGGVPLPAAEAVAWLGSSFGARGLPKRDVATQRRERCRCNRVVVGLVVLSKQWPRVVSKMALFDRRLLAYLDDGGWAGSGTFHDRIVGYQQDSDIEMLLFQAEVVEFDSEGQLAFKRKEASDSFVFGGDVFDKGDGDLRIAKQLLSFKKSHPDRVWLLAGNRDLNKLRFPAELAEDEIDVPQPVPLYPRAPPQVSLRSFLEKRLESSAGKTVQDVNTRANRLRWILDHTMTATGAFELRQQELALLSGQEASEIHDEDVVESFLTSVSKEDGVVWEYLLHSCLLVMLGDCLFVHGGLPKEAINWVPTMDMRYLQPAEGAVCGGRRMEGTLQDWMKAMNDFMQEGLRDFREKMYWGPGRTRGGEGLLCLTSTPACFRRSVVVESLLQGGTPDHLDKDVEAFLVKGGVRTVFCGHKPCGDSPFVVRGDHVAVVHCDTTYSDGAAPDKRGSAVAAVEVSAPTSGQLQLRGVLADGRSYDFALYGDSGDDLVGRQCCDGSWVKAKLPEGCYHVVSSEGTRKLRYDTRSQEELQGLLARHA
ncbi:hypothetical protein AK812_SmicGene45511 [Symbiodinium microadriaticum]|uniref:Uncharacterized protein n=1 Tax=Symbiodinium microadriaticum TaxID=2951 RepID=A0A1Q9BVY3_SYMMI|nr:hypothetical protein AK812_SmicGene45511 [Symbiodinium microadriaticum]